MRSIYFVLQLTTETYGDCVALLSQIIELTENNINEQTDGVLSKTASYFEDLADFLNVFNVIINTTVSVDDQYSLQDFVMGRYILLKICHKHKFKGGGGGGGGRGAGVQWLVSPIISG